METILHFFDQENGVKFWQVAWVLVVVWTIGVVVAAVLRRKGFRIYTPSVTLMVGVAFGLQLIPFVFPFVSLVSILRRLSSGLLFAAPFLITAVIVVLVGSLVRLSGGQKRPKTDTVDMLGYRLVMAFLILANCYWIALISTIDL